MTEPVKKRSKGKINPEALARLKAAGKIRVREHPQDLPAWAKIAMVKHELLGQSWRDIANQLKKHPGRVHDMKSSPAAKKFMAALQELTDDPVALAREILRGAAVGMAVENLLHYEAAKNAGDMGEAGRQLRFLTETVGVSVPKNMEQAPAQIVINLGGVSVTADIPMGSSTGEKLLPAPLDVEIIE